MILMLVSIGTREFTTIFGQWHGVQHNPVTPGAVSHGKVFALKKLGVASPGFFVATFQNRTIS